MSQLGTFYGVGVGPGPSGYVSVAAVEALKKCDIIFCPKADYQENSVTQWCLSGIEFANAEIRQIPFKMDPNRDVLKTHYYDLSVTIGEELKQGKNIGYLTLGDPFTFSTYGYTIAALMDLFPELPHKTFPGVTSFATIAAETNFPLGEGKERILILPCPDDAEALQADIESHDVIVLMKIGKRLSMVLDTLKKMNIAEHCVFAKRIGFADEILCSDVSTLSAEESLGYLSTMLIRKQPIKKRHL
ncbi:MAG: precorrin-2/cobalt-factor-2 C20-methyltransferase [bacterium]|jgi:precorrin-2/cobalt-factor-2 C20-methyltransferase